MIYSENSNNREMRENIARTKERVGWLYAEMKWLSGSAAVSANRVRDALLGELSGKAAGSFQNNKLHLGGLSKGCLLCGRGYWSCMFINGLCTANCFYCPQDRGIKTEPQPNAHKLAFKSPLEYAAFLKKYNYKGVGFSGGEPLLVFSKLLEYITVIRRQCGKGLHIWLYTNGDLADTDKLKMLKNAGLDEIRFDISARNYELRRAAAAVGIIKTVAVEIPAIPEDLPILKRCLRQIKKAGITCLNLHQLMANRHNYKNYLTRGYTFLHYPEVAVVESEITALRLMKYSIGRNIGLRINYCSAMYKSRLQGQGGRQRWGNAVKEKNEELTRVGYVRRISVQDTPQKIKAFTATLRRLKFSENLWSLNKEKTEITLNGVLLKAIAPGCSPVTVKYYQPCLTAAQHAGEQAAGADGVVANKKIVAQTDGLNALMVQCFIKLFIDHVPERKVLDYLFKNYSFQHGGGVKGLRAATEALLSLTKLELPASGCPRLY